MSLRRYARMVKRTGRLLIGRDVLYRYDLRPKKLTLGTVYGGWTVARDFVRPSGVMYSFGVGTDISFDLAAIELFGLEVHGFDPSPHVATWIESQRLPDSYCFHAYGLGACDGNVAFFSPAQERGMYSLSSRHRKVAPAQECLPIRSLASIIESLGTKEIEILKMDVEGAEYELLSSVIGCPVPIRQLLIEFHHRIGIESLEKTVESVKLLRESGFQLFHVSETSSEFSFLRC